MTDRPTMVETPKSDEQVANEIRIAFAWLNAVIRSGRIRNKFEVTFDQEVFKRIGTLSDAQTANAVQIKKVF